MLLVQCKVYSVPRRRSKRSSECEKWTKRTGHDLVNSLEIDLCTHDATKRAEKLDMRTLTSSGQASCIAATTPRRDGPTLAPLVSSSWSQHIATAAKIVPLHLLSSCPDPIQHLNSAAMALAAPTCSSLDRAGKRKRCARGGIIVSRNRTEVIPSASNNRGRNWTQMSAKAGFSLAKVQMPSGPSRISLQRALKRS